MTKYLSPTVGAEEEDDDDEFFDAANAQLSNKSTEKSQHKANDTNAGKDTHRFGNDERCNSAKPQTSTVGEKPVTICKFYSNGNCKHGSSCRYLHPDICPIFMKKRLRKFNKNNSGCDENCSRLHPANKMCRRSLRTRTCNRERCPYIHIDGTTMPNRVRLQEKANPSVLAPDTPMTQTSASPANVHTYAHATAHPLPASLYHPYRGLLLQPTHRFCQMHNPNQMTQVLFF